MTEGGLTVAPWTRRAVRVAACAGFVGASLSVIWASLGDCPLHSNSEGRYACVSEVMADGGSWLVPSFQGEPHLTKPPLTYWAEALCLRVFGHTEFAVRFPSALAGTLTALGLLALGWRIGGARLGLFSLGLFVLMPLPVTMFRLTMTDALMGLWWFGVLAGGYLCVEELCVESGTCRDENRDSGRSTHNSQRIWPCVLLWTSFALGFLTKAPLSVVPLGVLVVWLVLAGRWREIRRLHPVRGLPLAMVPFAVWVWLIVDGYPGVWDLWYQETFGRAMGSGIHHEPVWFYLPVFFVGMLPATLITSLPGINYSWRSAWRTLREGRPQSLWALAVVLPFAFFSISSGKLISYLLPLAPPMALLSGGLLKRLLESGPPSPGDVSPDARPRREPPVHFALFAGSAVGLATVVWFTMQFGHQGFAIGLTIAPGVLLFLAGAWLWGIWKRRPKQRFAALAAVWAAFVLTWLAAHEVEDDYFGTYGSRMIVERIRERTGWERFEVGTFGFHNSAFAFYTHAASEARGDLAMHPARLSRPAKPRPLALVVDPKDWRKFARTYPAVARRFQTEITWDRGPFSRRRLVLVPRPEVLR